MIRRSAGTRRRSAAAAVEFAVVMNFVLVPLMIGLWEMGRVVYVQQLVANSAREGARLAAQGLTINDNGTQNQIVTSIDPASNTNRNANVKATVYQYLVGAGLSNLLWSDLTVSFAFPSPPLDPLPMPAVGSQQPAPIGGEPWQGVKGQRFQVTVSIPYSKVQWSILGLVNPTTIGYSVEWRMLVDDTFNVNSNLPPW